MNAVFEPGWTSWSSPALSVGGQYFIVRTKMIGPIGWSVLIVSVKLPPAPSLLVGGTMRNRRAVLAVWLLPEPEAVSLARCTA